MKFTEMRSTMASFSGAKTAEYQIQYISSGVTEVLKGLNGKFVEYLTNDLTDLKSENDFRTWITNTYYGASNDNAKECLELCLNVKHLYGRKIKSWTDNALKCYDNFLLKYIQEDRVEKIKPNIKVGTEREVYWHLIDLGGDLQQIGQAFDNIYLARNEFQHIQIIDQNGNRTPKKLSNSKYNEKRDLIMGWFKSALILMLDKIK